MKILFILLITSPFANAQTSSLQINPKIILPKDTSETKKLTSALNEFLSAAQRPNEENKLVYEPEKIETFILLDEMNGIEKSVKKNDPYFYKPYLTNVVALKGDRCLIQVSYIGVNEGIAMLRASFELIAHKVNNAFSFSSPLLENAQLWKVDKTGNNTFHYKTSLNKAKVKEFNKLTILYDQKLKSQNKSTDYYCCSNITELQRLIGVQYKLDYNGRSEGTFNSTLGDRGLVVFGNNNSEFNEFDPHDLFHYRLSLVISGNKVNRSVNEGCAYLYGGSWGLSWKEIFKAFQEQVASNKSTDWAKIKETPAYFKTNQFNNSVDYVVNALLVQKIEKEKGFAGVWELLTVGPFEKGNEKYYQTLEKLTGITKANYNDKVWELISNERN